MSSLSTSSLVVFFSPFRSACNFLDSAWRSTRLRAGLFRPHEAPAHPPQLHVISSQGTEGSVLSAGIPAAAPAKGANPVDPQPQLFLNRKISVLAIRPQHSPSYSDVQLSSVRQLKISHIRACVIPRPLQLEAALK
jgi:hypothetical protein